MTIFFFGWGGGVGGGPTVISKEGRSITASENESSLLPGNRIRARRLSPRKLMAKDTSSPDMAVAVAPTVTLPVALIYIRGCIGDENGAFREVLHRYIIS